MKIGFHEIYYELERFGLQRDVIVTHTYDQLTIAVGQRRKPNLKAALRHSCDDSTHLHRLPHWTVVDRFDAR